MSAHGFQLRDGVPFVLALVCGSAALAAGPLCPGAQYAAGLSPDWVAVCDLDGDQWPDFAVANYASDAVSVLLENGDGTFAVGGHYSAGDGARAVAAADLDGDESANLAVVNQYGDGLSVLLN